MKLLEIEKGYLLLIEFEENENFISAKAEDTVLLGIDQEKKLNISGQTEIIPRITMTSLFPNMFGITKSTYPKHKIVIHDLHPDSSLVKEIQKQRSLIQVVEAPKTGDKNLDRKILQGKFGGNNK